ncbi:MAG: magnesium/cobalt transporter CorA [Deltaproteobacteria bacterium]|nr:magnesium/cobalt transporter CorA [Deltaproteobacteria bacterium]
MTTRQEHQTQKLNLPPGSLVHIGQRLVEAPRITAIEYVDDAYSCRELSGNIDEVLQTVRAFPDRKSVLWLNIDGIHEAKTVEAIGKAFSLHPLIREDVMNTELRPKLDEYDDCVFIVIKMLDYDEAEQQIIVEQVSMVLGDGFLLTFQERFGDVFDAVRSRIKDNAGKIRKMKADYLAYRLLDAIIDHYFVALEALAEIVDSLEERLADTPDKVRADELHTLRRETLFLRKSITPARELIGTLARIEDPQLITPSVEPYLRDIHDHVVQVSESVEHTREVLASMLDIYHASLSNKMNEVMKVLSIVTAIFIPLSFIAGVYGMNFQHMPELKEPIAYPVVLSLMLLIGGAIAWFTKRKRWW